MLGIYKVSKENLRSHSTHVIQGRKTSSAASRRWPSGRVATNWWMTALQSGRGELLPGPGKLGKKI